MEASGLNLLNSDFNYALKLKEYAGNPDWQDNEAFWSFVSGATNDAGSVLHERLVNMSRNLTDVDTCGLKELHSIMLSLGVQGGLEYASNLPNDLYDLMCVLSVKSSYLLKTNKLLLDSSIANIQTQIGSAYFQMSGTYFPALSAIPAATVSGFASDAVGPVDVDRIFPNPELYLSQVCKASLLALLTDKVNYVTGSGNDVDLEQMKTLFLQYVTADDFVSIVSDNNANHDYYGALVYGDFCSNLTTLGELPANWVDLVDPVITGVNKSDILNDVTTILSDLALKTVSQREWLKELVNQYSIIGTNTIAEKFVGNFVLKNYTKRSELGYSGTDVVVNDPSLPALSSIAANFKVELIEYYDLTQYMNISAAAPYTIDYNASSEIITMVSTELDASGNLLSGYYDVSASISGYTDTPSITGGNERFWESDAYTTAMVSPSGVLSVEQQSIVDFYKNLDESQSLSSLPIINNLLTGMWDANVTSSLVNVNADMHHKYIGDASGYTPAYNYNNQQYPTIAPINNLLGLTENTIAQGRDFHSATVENRTGIIPYVEVAGSTTGLVAEMVDVSGNMIDSWKFGNNELRGYISRYENSVKLDNNYQVSRYVDVDGPLVGDALSGLIALCTDVSGNINPTLTSGQIDTFKSDHAENYINPYYLNQLTNDFDTQLSAYTPDIFALSGQTISQFNTDIYGNQFTLYKSNVAHEPGDTGKLWMRFANTPFSFPAAYPDATYATSGVLLDQLDIGIQNPLLRHLLNNCYDFGIVNDVLWVVGLDDVVQTGSFTSINNELSAVVSSIPNSGVSVFQHTFGSDTLFGSIIDNGRNVIVDDGGIAYTTNSVSVDLSTYSIAGSWQAAFIDPAAVTGFFPQTVVTSFTSSSLASGLLILSHNFGNINMFSAIVDGNRKNISLDDHRIQYSNNQIRVDLSQYNVTGTWGAAFVGIGGATNPSAVVSSQFTNSDLVSGVLSISHQNGSDSIFSAIIDNGYNITPDDRKIEFGDGVISVDLSQYNVTGNWQALFIDTNMVTRPRFNIYLFAMEFFGTSAITAKNFGLYRARSVGIINSSTMNPSQWFSYNNYVGSYYDSGKLHIIKQTTAGLVHRIYDIDNKQLLISTQYLTAYPTTTFLADYPPLILSGKNPFQLASDDSYVYCGYTYGTTISEGVVVFRFFKMDGTIDPNFLTWQCPEVDNILVKLTAGSNEIKALLGRVIAGDIVGSEAYVMSMTGSDLKNTNGSISGSMSGLAALDTVYFADDTTTLPNVPALAMAQWKKYSYLLTDLTLYTASLSSVIVLDQVTYGYDEPWQAPVSHYWPGEYEIEGISTLEVGSGMDASGTLTGFTLNQTISGLTSGLQPMLPAIGPDYASGDLMSGTTYYTFSNELSAVVSSVPNSGVSVYQHTYSPHALFGEIVNNGHNISMDDGMISYGAGSVSADLTSYAISGDWKAMFFDPNMVSAFFPQSISVVFDDSSLISGLLSLSHNFGDISMFSAITDGNKRNILLDDRSIRYSTNEIRIDLSQYHATGNWAASFIGIGEATNPSAVVSSQFTKSDLVSGVLSINHQNGSDSMFSAIIDNGYNIALDDSVITFRNGVIDVDLSQYDVTGTWQALFINPNVLKATTHHIGGGFNDPTQVELILGTSGTLTGYYGLPHNYLYVDDLDDLSQPARIMSGFIHSNYLGLKNFYDYNYDLKYDLAAEKMTAWRSYRNLGVNAFGDGMWLSYRCFSDLDGFDTKTTAIKTLMNNFEFIENVYATTQLMNQAAPKSNVYSIRISNSLLSDLSTDDAETLATKAALRSQISDNIRSQLKNYMPGHTRLWKIEFVN